MNCVPSNFNITRLVVANFQIRESMPYRVIVDSSVDVNFFYPLRVATRVENIRAVFKKLVLSVVLLIVIVFRRVDQYNRASSKVIRAVFARSLNSGSISSMRDLNSIVFVNSICAMEPRINVIANRSY